MNNLFLEIANDGGVIHGALSITRVPKRNIFALMIHDHSGSFSYMVVGEKQLRKLGMQIREMVGTENA